MTINLHVSLCPDGDFSLRDNEKYHMEWDGNDYYQEYLFYEGLPQQTWEDSTDHTFDPLWRACRLLEKMICDIHVSYTHHYLLDYLYHMFDDAMEAIGRREKSFEVEVSGNYEGTFISFEITED